MYILTSKNCIMKNYLKIILLTGLISFVSCSKEEDFAVVTDYIPVLVGENYENSEAGSGANEISAETIGWLNYNFAETGRDWNVKEYNNNKYAEFSSYYSNAADPNDEVWMITSKMNFAETPITESLTFDTQQAYTNAVNAILTVLISTDFDGTTDGIHTATWTELSFNLPTANNVWTSSGRINLSEYQSFNSVYVAFKYEGSKSAGTTTTFRLDNIRVFENK